MLESQLEKWIVSHAAQPIPLALVLPSGQRVELGPSPRVVIRMRDVGAARYLLDPTLSNIGTAYVEERIDIEGHVDDIIDVAVALAQDASQEEFVEGGNGLWQRLRAHTRKRDREAIEYHYDVSNEFYRLFLDTNMVYSCAYFRHPDESLDKAQENKLEHILTKLQVKPGDRFLDIGSGWGALIIRAAQRGAYAVGVTLSKYQFDWTQAAIARAGVRDRCEVRMQDYRDIPEVGSYDKIASIGMVEHVGLKNLGLFSSTLHQLLRDGGAVLLHGITATHPDRREVGRGGGEFIDKYVFPDGELPHLSAEIRAMSLAGFEIADVESLRRHYAKTLAHWAHRFEANSETARAAVGEKRYRIWRVYLAGCSFGFDNNWMNIHQILACKLGAPGSNPFPMTRGWMYGNLD